MKTRQKTMEKRVPYLEWRNRTRTEISDTHRIGDDLILIEEYNIKKEYKEPFKLDITTAIIYEEGSVNLAINMKEYHISAPAMVVMVSNQTIQYISSDSNMKIKAISFSDKLFSELFKDSHISASLYRSIYENPVAELTNDDKLVLEQFYNMMLHLIKSPTGEHRLEAARHLILTLFYGYMIGKNESNITPQEKRNRATDLSDSFLELLRNNFRAKHDIGYYADKLCITPKYLSRCVKEVTGRTATDWIESYIINESKALLASTRLTIQQISDRMGFLSTALFGKFFKRVEGITPTAYRKSRRN